MIVHAANITVLPPQEDFYLAATAATPSQPMPWPSNNNLEKALRQLRILRNSTTIIMAEKNPVRKDLLRRAQSDLPAALSLIASLFMVLVAIASSLLGSN
jgi:hypothetical protein